VIKYSLHKHLQQALLAAAEGRQAGPAAGGWLDLTLNDVHQAFEHAFQQADRELREAAVRVSGSTVLCCLLLQHSSGQKTLHVANVGDSRAVLCRNGQAERLSYDHKPSDPAEIERIRRHPGGFIINGRVAGILAVSRALGDVELTAYGVSAEPYQNEVLLTPTDTHLILACDGLWDVATDQEACDVLTTAVAGAAATAQPEPRAEELSKLLLDFALSHGTRDNVTVCVVTLS